MIADDPVLEAVGINKSFGSDRRRTTALDDVSFRVRRGAVTGLIGPDGAGKTTFMRLAAGLLVPDAGRVTVLGHDATRDALQVQAALGYMPQRFGLYEDLKVQENLDLYADLQGLQPEDRPPRYAELMHMTGLAPFTARLAGRLSGGMKQKLGLACTLLRSPRLLLLDEPTVGVDPVSRRELWSIVDRLVRAEGMSVLLSTAYLDEAERCAEVVLIHEGKILEQGPPAGVSARMTGRTWAVSRPGMHHRELQARLDGQPGVVDALVQGEHVRLVAATSHLPEWIVRMPQIVVRETAPRFEDGFIDLLRRRVGTTADAPATGGEGRAPAVDASDDGGRSAADSSSSDRNRGAYGPPHSGSDDERPAKPAEPVVIRVDGLRRRFGDFWAVDGIDLRIRRGEIFGLLGANGAGKTTTFRMLCGLLPPTEGHLEVAGQDVRRAAAAARARIGYMSQKFSLYGNLSVAQNLDFFASAYGLPRALRRERIAGAIAEFDLGELADQLAAELPLGYKQRLAMACALMHQPEIIFLDEPTSGVDPLARREFWKRINERARRGVTVLVTTHFMEEAEYCDRLAIMVAGRILATDEPARIKTMARSDDNPQPTMEDAFIRLVEGPALAEAAS